MEVKELMEGIEKYVLSSRMEVKVNGRYETSKKICAFDALKQLKSIWFVPDFIHIHHSEPPQSVEHRYQHLRLAACQLESSNFQFAINVQRP